MPRAKPFSGKQKKQQLQAKREKKRLEDEEEDDGYAAPHAPAAAGDAVAPAPDDGKTVIMAGRAAQPKAPVREADPNRLRTVFDIESRDEIERRKTAGRDPLDTRLRDEPWRISDELLSEGFLPIPLRPAVHLGETKEAQEQREEAAFAEWREKLRDVPPERLNYFEQNIEVWRQLWRTFERSDVILLLTDARYPLFHFPPALYDYVTNVIKKPIILVLNKRDLVPAEIVAMWRRWFEARYPNLRTVPVASFRAPLDDADALAAGRKRKIAKGKKRYESAEGLEDLVDAIRALGIKKQGEVVNIPPFRRPGAASAVATKPAAAAAALTSAKGSDAPEKPVQKAESVATRLYVGNLPADVSEKQLWDFITATLVAAKAVEEGSATPVTAVHLHSAKSFAFVEFTSAAVTDAALAYLDGASLRGSTLRVRRPVDYVAATAEDSGSDDDSEAESDSVEDLAAELQEVTLNADGKPKLGQTPFVVVGTVGHPNVGKSSLINGLMGRKVVSTSRTPGHTKHFQTIFLSPELQLMDCPGLVFPALDRPKALQVLCGLYPLAQVREFFSPLRYLAERVPVERIYALRLPPDTHRWSPWAIAEALALQRGYTLARGGRPDIHKAGREILTDCLDGRIVFAWPPPGHEAEVREYLLREAEARKAALLTPPAAVDRSAETEEEAEARRAAKRDKKAEARRIKRLGPGHEADPRAVSRVLAQVAAAREEEEEAEAKPPAGKASKDAERAREYAERQAARQGRRKRGDGPLEL